MPNLICKVCDGAELKRKKIYRMSAPVVLIGYIFLIPSLLGMLMGILGVAGSSQIPASSGASSDAHISTELRSKGVPEYVISGVVNDAAPATIDKSQLSEDQRRAVESAIMSKHAESVGSGAATVVAGGLSMLLIVFFFCGGLIGWLLVMKKRVLKCNSCGATVAAD